ncbi:MAG: hypothetical protein HN842_12320 [Gammaproteobacteria bacterium]|jgi:hypothetical protein|nr:hypothetical protein [Gammaproteobacteria bacterium]MBT7308995.1 hypothetical protein [Gammaproteobacteria bacterium]
MKQSLNQPIIHLMIPLLFLSTSVLGDDEREHHRSYPQQGAALEQYKQECGSCHLAYPPRFLGKASWNQIMLSLGNHFGESAELEPNEQQEILHFLTQNSSSRRWYPFWKKKGEEAPIRITKTRSFRHEHDEIPRHLVVNNPKIGSLSQCERCHTGASEGSFNEHQVHIPGFGRWDD